LLGRFSTPARRDALGRALAKVSVAAMRARMRAVLLVDRSNALQRTNVPLLYLRAAADRMVPASASREVMRARPDAKFVELPGPHFLLQVAPAKAADDIHSFVRELVSVASDPLSADQPTTAEG
jgi:pimeloyl-ACP methyl ester carboxylesterase